MTDLDKGKGGIPHPAEGRVNKERSTETDSLEDNQTPFMITKAKKSIAQNSDCPPSPLLLERSVVEFERQVEVVYNAKMIPRPKSTHTESSSIGGSTLRKNGTLNRNSLPPNGAAFVQPNSRNPFTRCCSAFRSLIEDALDTFFFNYGKLVASHPFTFILLCVLLTSVCGIGMINFRMENTGLKLWIPHDSSQR